MATSPSGLSGLSAPEQRRPAPRPAEGTELSDARLACVRSISLPRNYYESYDHIISQ